MENKDSSEQLMSENKDKRLLDFIQLTSQFLIFCFPSKDRQETPVQLIIIAEEESE